MTIAQDLSESQRRIVTSEAPLLLISAGPGTGKTHTLVNRVRYLISHKYIPANSIFAITFTRKAATELKDRLSRETKNTPFIGTFHAFSSLVIKECEGRDLEMITKEEREEIISDIFRKKTNETFSKRQISLYITKKKNQLNCGANDPLVEEYNKYLSVLGKVDYDDIIQIAFRMISSDSGKNFMRRVRYMNIDEFQDTSAIQLELVKLFLRSGASLFAIGDPRQSIYSFRGAGAEAFDGIKREFSKVKQYSLEINYRSQAAIVRSAESLFAGEVPLRWSRSGEGSAIITETLDEFTEADFILKQINSHVGGIDLNNIVSTQDEILHFSDFAVIYRSHHIRRAIEKKMFDSGIPYQVIGEGSPYENPYIIKVIDYLKNIDNNFSETELFNKENIDIKANITTLIDYFIQYLNIRQPALAKSIRPYELTQFKQSFLRFDKYPDGLKRALTYIDYLSQREFYDPLADRVTLMTIHAAKGLEFKSVFLAGFEEGIIPIVRLGSETNIEEEKRLLYVAMTRAANALYLTRTRSRARKPTQISQFEKMIKKDIGFLLDPVLPLVERKRSKQRDKRNQMKMF